jgi:2'-5' RNA ligase
MDIIRAFIAIPLPASILTEIEAVQRQLERRMPRESVRWVRTEGIHLTLKFLGDTETSKLPAIQQALAAMAQEHASCHYAVRGLGCFPDFRRPRVIWVGLDEPSGKLAALQRAVERTMAPLGYPKEGRGFTPHLTLGRVKDRLSPGDVAAIGQGVATSTIGQLGDAEADSFELIKSVLKPAGAEYATLTTFPLGLE